MALKTHKRHDYKQRPAPRYENKMFIPPAPVPVTGTPQNWDMIDSLMSLRALSGNPIEATTEISTTQLVTQAKVYGTIMTVPADPELIRYLFVETADNLALHPVRQAILRPVLEDGLITVAGAQWKRIRHLLAPVFTPRHTKAFAPAMAKTAQRVLPDLFTDGEEVLLTDKMLSLAYLVLSDALFSGDIEEDTAQVLQNIAAFLAQMGRPNILDVIEAPKWIPRLNQIKGKPSVNRVRQMISAATAKRQADKDAGRKLPDDFLTLLLNAGDDEQAPLTGDEIEDQILTFIGAGHETTSRALNWMFYLLANDENARTRLEAEVDALDTSLPPEQWASHIPWAMACFEETMRLYPPAPFISRKIINEDQWEEYTFPAGSALMVNLWALHRHEKLWDHPNAFDPERFYGQARSEIGRFQYLPFGLGHRVCIGQRFALQEAAILIAMIARDYRFDYIGERPPWPKMRVTIQADNHMPMRVIKRKR